MIAYADQYWPQKPIKIPANPSIKFTHTFKTTNQNTQAKSVEELMEQMKNPTDPNEGETYTNSALLSYTINGEVSSVPVFPGDWILVYEDGMVVVKQNSQFEREYDELPRGQN